MGDTKSLGDFGLGETQLSRSICRFFEVHEFGAVRILLTDYIRPC